MSSVQVLEILFGSKSRARMMRFFILNNSQEYSFPDIITRNILNSSEARKELNAFKKADFVREKTKKGKKYYHTNINFPFYQELERLVIKSDIFPQCSSLGNVKKIGDVKLVLTTGVFMNYAKGKLDLLLVVDNVSRVKLKTLINHLEAEVGKEIRYMVLTGDELTYRLNMLDRFLINIFKEPHEIFFSKVPKIKQIVSVLKK
ncbi:MAG: hypothetical protein ACWGHO_03600 [Candidatus Moraniibacteriota bacterium]